MKGIARGNSVVRLALMTFSFPTQILDASRCSSCSSQNKCRVKCFAFNKAVAVTLIKHNKPNIVAPSSDNNFSFRLSPRASNRCQLFPFELKSFLIWFLLVYCDVRWKSEQSAVRNWAVTRDSHQLLDGSPPRSIIESIGDASIAGGICVHRCVRKIIFHIPGGNRNVWSQPGSSLLTRFRHEK